MFESDYCAACTHLDPSRTSWALNYVVNLLSRREYSAYEIRQKMAQKAFSDEEIETTVAKVQDRGWQSDVRFTENYLRNRAERGYGLRRIRQELSQKGIENSLITLVIEENQDSIDWQVIAQRQLVKKFPHYQEKLSPKDKQKVWRYMFSHGFSSDDFAHFVGNSDYDDFY